LSECITEVTALQNVTVNITNGFCWHFLRWILYIIFVVSGVQRIADESVAILHD